MLHGLIFSARSDIQDRANGAHRIATVLRQNDMDVEVIDFAAMWPLAALQEFAKKSIKSSTIFIGFSTFFSFWNTVLQDFVDWLKKKYPNITLIVGGQNVLLTKASNIDIWVDSFGELAIIDIVKNLAGNSTKNIVFDSSLSGSRKVVRALTAYPAVNMGDYSVLLEKRDYVQPYEWLTIEFARGCRFKCAFCNFPILGVKEDVSRTSESVEREIKFNFDNFGVTRYCVADETFNDRTEKVIKFADVVEKVDFDPFFCGFIRADLFPSNPEMVTQLARMNFGGQYYGIETFTKKAGVLVGKGMEPEKLKQCLLDTRKYMVANSTAYRGTISLIVGLPGETRDTWQETKQWLFDNWTSDALVVFPLDIQDTNRTSKLTNVSSFSVHLQKYGIRRMQRNSTAISNEKFFSTLEQGKYYDVPFMWEHDGMDIHEANLLATEMQQHSFFDFKLDCWQLKTIDFNNATKSHSIRDILQRPKVGGQVDAGAAQQFLNLYINNKLN